jgi:hypothetical protein
VIPDLLQVENNTTHSPDPARADMNQSDAMADLELLGTILRTMSIFFPQNLTPRRIKSE